MRYIKFFEAINESLEQSMRKDPKIILMGLGVTDPKGMVIKEFLIHLPQKMQSQVLQ